MEDWANSVVLSFLYVGDYPLAGLPNHATCFRWNSGRLSNDVCTQHLAGQFITVGWHINGKLLCFSTWTPVVLIFRSFLFWSILMFICLNILNSGQCVVGQSGQLLMRQNNKDIKKQRIDMSLDWTLVPQWSIMFAEVLSFHPYLFSQHLAVTFNRPLNLLMGIQDAHVNRSCGKHWIKIQIFSLQSWFSKHY
jgi:hypothetical protein